MTRGPRRNLEREERMRELFASGLTLQEIGDRYSLTRERVRQILSRAGVTKQEGGLAKRTKIKALAVNEIKAAKRERRCLTAYGCTHATLRAICGDKPRASMPQLMAYQQQKANAVNRGIEWALTFPQWWAVWQASGHYADRGRRRDSYVMARRNDAGPYALWNVYITTSVQNIVDGYAFRRRRREAA